ncbi:hypothetical protein DSO57_1017761 [Entomophthora muscae]|uniref:Uncharacterized protein n=1 Tax=Entomophthora muscae TaxID=34485 RepID=A0ACC2RJ53_9FUNG|nr:hypothetical protein DSO57_1017761 [Entomophthora muscae]
MKGLQLIFAGAILSGSYNDESPSFNAEVCANSTAIANVLASDVDGLEKCLGKTELYFSRPNKICQEPCRATVVKACQRVVKECPGLGKGNKVDAFSKVGTYRLWADKSNVDVMCNSLGNNNSTCLEDLFKAAADVQNAKAQATTSKTSNYGNHDLTEEQIKRVCTPCTRDIYDAFQGKEDQAPGLYMLELIDPKQDIEGIGEICGYNISPKEEASQTNTEQTNTSKESSKDSSQQPQYEEPSSQGEAKTPQDSSQQPQYEEPSSQGEAKTSPQEPSQGESKTPSYNPSPQEPITRRIQDTCLQPIPSRTFTGRIQDTCLQPIPSRTFTRRIQDSLLTTHPLNHHKENPRHLLITHPLKNLHRENPRRLLITHPLKTRSQRPYNPPLNHHKEILHILPLETLTSNHLPITILLALVTLTSSHL